MKSFDFSYTYTGEITKSSCLIRFLTTEKHSIIICAHDMLPKDTSIINELETIQEEVFNRLNKLKLVEKRLTPENTIWIIFNPNTLDTKENFIMQAVHTGSEPIWKPITWEGVSKQTDIDKARLSITPDDLAAVRKNTMKAL